MTDAGRDFWNAQASKGAEAGTRDLIAAHLEREAIAKHVRDGMHILDVGCGTGETAIGLAQKYNVAVTGIDYAPEMVRAATRKQLRSELKGSAYFQVSDLTELANFRLWYGEFDLVYSQRALINLPSWEVQEQAIRNIIGLLRPGGTYLACECCVEGLDEMNEARAELGLPAIAAPWHNRYIHAAEMEGLEIDGAYLVGWEHPAGLYYFLSRIVNASLAAQAGQSPDYNSEVNKIALKLSLPLRFGQGRMWVWRRKA